MENDKNLAKKLYKEANRYIDNLDDVIKRIKMNYGNDQKLETSDLALKLIDKLLGQWLLKYIPNKEDNKLN